VSVEGTINAVFSEGMNASTITPATFLVNAGGSNISGTVSYSGTTAIFTPASKMAFGTTYAATITTGVKDNAGNAMASNYSWSFATITDNVLSLDGLDDKAEAAITIFPNTATVSSFTVEAWIYPTDSGTYILSDDAYSLILFYQSGASNNGLGIRFYVFAPTCSSFTAKTEFRDIRLNQWNHVAGMYDAPAGQLFISINGVLSSSPASLTTSTFCSTPNDRLSVGARYAQPGDTFKGEIDEVRISDNVRYRTNFTPLTYFATDANTKGLWHFDQPAGSTTLADSSGNGNTLTGLNGPQIVNR
jgi:hypothetical protein